MPGPPDKVTTRYEPSRPARKWPGQFGFPPPGPFLSAALGAIAGPAIRFQERAYRLRTCSATKSGTSGVVTVL